MTKTEVTPYSWHGHQHEAPGARHDQVPVSCCAEHASLPLRTSVCGPRGLHTSGHVTEGNWGSSWNHEVATQLALQYGESFGQPEVFPMVTGPSWGWGQTRWKGGGDNMGPDSGGFQQLEGQGRGSPQPCAHQEPPSASRTAELHEATTFVLLCASSNRKHTHEWGEARRCHMKQDCVLTQCRADVCPDSGTHTGTHASGCRVRCLCYNALFVSEGDTWEAARAVSEDRGPDLNGFAKGWGLPF